MLNAQCALACWFAVAAPIALAADNELVGYYAQPALHGDKLVFQSGGDLWTTQVPAKGQRALAHRLTSAAGVEGRPTISPDGTRVAFMGYFDGNPEAFVMPIAGGPLTRLTTHPGRDMPVAWTPDGTQILLRSDRACPHGDFEFFLVPATGGTIAPLPFKEGMLGSFNRTTGELAFNPRSNESWYWKGYRGGTAPDIWVASRDNKEYRRITKTEENELFPMWVGDRIYFLADTDGRMNLWSVKGDGSDRTQHTHAGSKDYDLRWPSADASGAPVIAYAQGGDIYLYEQGGGTSRKLDIALQGDRLQDRARVESAGKNLSEVALSCDGKRLAAVSRGEVIVGPAGKPKPGVPQNWLQLPGRSSSREVGVTWGPDGSLYMVSDRGGEASLVVCDLDDVTRGDSSAFTTLAKADRWIFAPELSPDGKWLAFGDKSLRLRVLDVTAKTEREVGKSPAGEITDYKFSPDGRWLAWVATLPNGFGQIHMYDTRASVDRVISTGLTDDRTPRWDPRGKFLYFTSARAVNPLLDQFDLSFVSRDSWEFFAVPLTAAQAPPLEPAAASAGFDLKKWAEIPPDKSDADEGDEEGNSAAADKKDEEKKDEDKKDEDKKDEYKPRPNPDQPRGQKDGGKVEAGKPGEGKPADSKSADSKQDDNKSASRKSNGRKKADGSADAEGESTRAVEIEFEGLMSRAVKLPVDAGSFRDVNAVYGGLLYLRVPAQGVADEIWPAPVLGMPGAKLEQLDLVEGKAKEVMESTVDAVATSADARWAVFATTDGGAGGGPGPGGGPDGGKGSGDESGPTIKVISLAEPGKPEDAHTVPVGKVELAVDVAAEWAQIFDEGWRLQRDFFWKPDLGGVDWKAARAKYAALLPRISTRAELNDLVGEMSAELGTSHTYIDGGDEYLSPQPSSIGLLGVDVSKTGEGFRIDAILPDQSATGGPESPLAAPHRNVKAGDVIVAVDGRSAKDVNELGELLRGRAGKNVALALRSADDHTRVLEVPTVTDEEQLRYLNWVDNNRKTVLEKSGGRLGYMHLPDMDSAGLIAFVKGFYPQYLMDGLVIDERWNHGGYVSQMILERLRRKPIASDVPREGAPNTYPQRASGGPMAVLINERAGSDGDIFPMGFKMYGIGPLIGTRTWGGVVGIRSDKPFVDGGAATQPEFAWWDPVGGYHMENHGVDPDIVVERSPADIAAGKDPQLDRAIAELMPKLDKENKSLKPPPPGKGNTTVPPAAR